jgi:adenine-specific DNA-methyltransferase
MENRLRLAKMFLKENGTLYLHLDHIAEHYGKLLLDNIFGKDKFQAKITWNTGENISGFKSQALNWIRQADFIHFYSKSKDFKFHKVYELLEQDNKYGWLDLLGRDKKNLFIEVWENGEFKRKKVDEEVKPKGTIWNDIYSFQYSEPRITESIAFVSNQKPENLLRRIIQSSSDPKDLVLDFFLGSGTTTAVAHKLKRKWIGVEMGEFFNEIYIDEIEVKNSQLEMINKSAIVSVITEKEKSKILKLKKLGLLGRMKIVLYGDKEFYAIHSKQKRSPHLSKDINWQGGGFFKYHTLEQYEDALENVEFEQQSEKQQELLSGFSDYFVKYMLEWETKNCSTFLNVEKLKDPFNYKLKIMQNYQQKIVNVDLIETFNYLIGLNISRYKVSDENGRKYVFVFGEKEGKKTAVVWRSLKNIDFEKDRKIIEREIKNFNPDIVYVNGDSMVKGFTAIEPVFKTLMFEKVE